MNINETSNYLVSRPQSNVNRPVTSRSQESGGKQATRQVESKLIDSLARTQVESRAEVVGDIKVRIQNGEFLTRDAAEKAADSILGS